MRFIYTDKLTEEQLALLYVPIKDCLCKHVMRMTPRAQQVYNACIDVYPVVRWGTRIKLLNCPESNWIYQTDKIKRMVAECYKNSIRVVIGDNKQVWIDNLHSAIRDILIYGENHKLVYSRIYVVDLRADTPVVVDVSVGLRDSVKDIIGAIECSYRRMERVDGKLYDIRYTVGEFMKDNNITRESLNLSEDAIDKYKHSEAGILA